MKSSELIPKRVYVHERKWKDFKKRCKLKNRKMWEEFDYLLSVYLGEKS